jgi:predicted nucleotidyltransferase
MTVDAESECLEDPSLAETRRIVFEVLGQQAVRVFLCGARTRGEAVPQADVEIAVLPPGPLPPGILDRLREALDASALAHEVDIVDLSTVEEPLRRKVLSEAVEWTA